MGRDSQRNLRAQGNKFENLWSRMWVLKMGSPKNPPRAPQISSTCPCPRVKRFSSFSTTLAYLSHSLIHNYCTKCSLVCVCVLFTGRKLTLLGHFRRPAKISFSTYPTAIYYSGALPGGESLQWKRNQGINWSRLKEKKYRNLFSAIYAVTSLTTRVEGAPANLGSFAGSSAIITRINRRSSMRHMPSVGSTAHYPCIVCKVPA